ncbi:MAG: DNA polymerase III subunit delta [Zetaproteobacteria bacterium]|nr:DNA polymerase III subunit delta [Zetaproteobacteria bacterium]
MLAQGILGHADTQQRFSDLYRQKKLPHAWMIYGMQGMGKAMLAHTMAQIYVCESLRPDGQACGQCHACEMVLGGSHPDLAQVGLDWDEKKKRFRRDIRVEQIRHALDFLTLTGMRSERRVMIIDDANRMNLAAANALLKGLEEPAEGALLLMVCHDLSALPETIRSRCMLEHCSPLALHDVRTVLKKMALPQTSLLLAENLAKGCPGRVQALNDETIASACLQWQTLTQSIQYADLGEIEAWLQKYVQKVPNELIVSILVEPLQHTIQEWMGDYELSEKIYIAVQGVLTWEHDVRAHALRPVPSLLARILQVRKVWKQAA